MSVDKVIQVRVGMCRVVKERTMRKKERREGVESSER